MAVSTIKPPDQPLVNQQIPGTQQFQGIQPMSTLQAGTTPPPVNIDPMTVAPPVPPAPTSSAPANANTSSFGADTNLLSTQINGPAPTATKPLTDFGTGAITAGASPLSDPQMQKYTSGLDSALSNLSNGPNRTQLAMQTLKDFDTAGQPELDAGFRKVGQQAAKFGRLGAGMTTNDLTGLQGTYDRNKMLLKNQLASSVAEGDINDRFRLADTYSNARGQQYGFGNTDRGYNTGVDQYNQGAAFDRARATNDANANYEDRLFNQQGANANNLQNERAYQTDRSDKAMQDAIQQKTLEDALLNSSFGRATSRLSAGEAGSPADAYQQGAAQLSGDAGQLMGAGAGLIQGANTKSPGIDMATLQQLLGLGS